VYSQIQRTNKRLIQDGGTNFIRLDRGPCVRPNMESRSRDKQGAQPGKPNSFHCSHFLLANAFYISFLRNLFFVRKSQYTVSMIYNHVNAVSPSFHVISNILYLLKFLEPESNSFGATTVSNLTPNSSVFWMHTVFAILYCVLMVIVLRHFTNLFAYESHDNSTKTIMITNVPKTVTADLITQHFR